MTSVKLGALCGVLAIGIMACRNLGCPQTALIEQLVDTQELAATLDPTVRLDSRFSRENDVQSFTAEYPFERHDPAEHYTIGVQVAPSGRFLNPVEYEARRASFKSQGLERPGDFPDIGIRAQRELFGVGPGGSAYGVTFTTRDGLYDVRVTENSLLPENVSAPQVDLDTFARRIEARYNSRFSHASAETQEGTSVRPNKPMGGLSP